MAPLDNSVKELPSRANLHDQVNVTLVLVRAFQACDVGMTGKVVHDLHFPLDILDVLWSTACRITSQGP